MKEKQDDYIKRQIYVFRSELMKKRLKAAIVLSLLCVGFLVLSLLKTSDSKRYPVVGLDRLDVEVIEDHNVALEHWVQKGIRSAALINIDAHDDMKRISLEAIERLKASYQQETAGTVKSGKGRFSNFPVTNGNFIYAAAKLGIVSRVYWIVPSTYDLFSDSGNQLVSLLKTYGFPDQDIETFTLKEGCFSGTAEGTPVFICQIERLPDISEPVLLTIDVDFFPEMNNAFAYKFTNSVKQTLSALFSKGYAIRDTTVAYSVSGGFLSASHRWAGDLVIDILKQPLMISQTQLPERYYVMQRADMLLLMNRYEELLEYILPLTKNDKMRPSLLTYAARAYQALGEFEKAFRASDEACLLEQTYCYVLPELGMGILEKHDLIFAESFFTRGYELYPGMDHGQFRYAMALKKAGRYEEAIKYFTAFRNIYGPFPVDLYLAETYLLKKDPVSALKYYDTGTSELLTNPYAIAGFGDLNAIRRAQQFYERNGYSRYASGLGFSIRPYMIN